MKLKAPEGDCPSINVAGVEYDADKVDGTVEISNDEHIAVAKREGFVEVETIVATEVQPHQES
jgi:hypothetical protein